jgi:hypothetical protein
VPRGRRYIESGAVYELCFRAKSTLPLVAYKCLNFIIQCVLARVQRDEKVILCHDIWNGSHPHLIVVSRDSLQLINFISEVQKKITDIIKRLLGLDYLEIWDGSPSIIKIGDLDAVIERIAYLYANPAQDNLETCIEKFPGASSWEDFQGSLTSLTAEVSKLYPWIRLPSVPQVRSAILSRDEDLEVLNLLKGSNKQLHRLTRSPNAWMEYFGVKDDSEVERINSRIIQLLRLKEGAANTVREIEGTSILGAARLQSQPILKPHTPKKRERKIFIISTIKEIRLEFIDRMRWFRRVCRECWERWRAGEFSVTWPPEAFKPPLPPTLNLLPT